MSFLQKQDPELYELISEENNRQRTSLELIASENFTSRAVMECLGSQLTNKYSEGLPGSRYYGGNEIIDKIENMCINRALETYGLDKNKWGVNVQPYSGSPANFAVYTGLLNPHDRIMGLDLPSGGHLTHGFYTFCKKTGKRKAVSATSIYFESLPYSVDTDTGLIDYDQLERDASLFKPAMIIMGGSAYARDWDYERFRKIADANGSILLMDMSHISGLIATNEHASPFNKCDIVTTTTHKSLRGPRAGMIFYKKDSRDFENKINQAVFPGLQGGPHEHQIAGIAAQLKEVQTDDFKNYIRQVKDNAKYLAEYLITQYGYRIVTNGTSNHLILWDLKPLKITGSKFEKICDLLSITLNKNCVPGDVSAISPGGVRIGTCALTTRGFNRADFKIVGDFLHKAVILSKDIQEISGPKLIDFIKVTTDNNLIANRISELKKEINIFASKYKMPGDK